MGIFIRLISGFANVSILLKIYEISYFSVKINLKDLQFNTGKSVSMSSNQLTFILCSPQNKWIYDLEINATDLL